VIWVNPTPDIVINVSDTVACNEATTTVTVSTPNVTLRGDWFYDISVTEMETGISSPDASLDDRRIAEGPLGLTLTNNTPHVKTVVFNFHPVIEPDDGGDDCENGVPNDTAITIFVNPTPVLLITVPRSVTDEQIYCNGADVAFSVVNNQQTVGDIKYDMEVTDENSVFSGNTPSENGRTVEDFTENPIHYQDTISGLNYRFIPYIEKLTGLPACYRPDNIQDFEIEVVPVLKSQIAPDDTVFGGFNITCNGFSDGVINLDAVGGDYRYNYSMEWRENHASGSLLQLTEYVKEDKLESLTAGSYYYSITDTLGCFHDSLKVLIEPDTLEIYFEDPQQPECYNGTNDGAIYVDVQGGAEMYDYTYEWFNIGTEEIQSTEQDMEDVYTGEYRLTFNDINGCTFVREYRLDSPDPLSSQVSFRGGYGTYNVSCTGEKDDSLVI
ncbi:MAG: hypothetical protein LC655_07180, partial [Bacteroidales bacterium]|nr:hypothetical protein [Bacteroidales bacterium]